MRPVQLPWDDPQWRKKFSADVEAACRRTGERWMAERAKNKNRILLRDLSPENSTPCLGYWQSSGDRNPHSTMEDEWGI